MLWDLSVNNMSLQFDHTHCLDKSEMEACLHFRVSNQHRRRQQWESFFVSHFTQRFNSILYTNFTTVDKSSTKTSVNSTSRIIMFLFLSTRGILGIHSCSENFCFQGFFIFIVPISTSSRSASISSMSSPSRARSVVRGFVGLTSALLCHTRFLAAEKCSQ